MESEERTLEFTAQCEPSQIAEYLEAIASYMRKGHVNLAVGTESVQLDLPGSVRLELEAKAKPGRGKGSLQLEVSWKQPPHFEDSLKIEAGEEPAAEPPLEIGKSK
jgi:amphi-Trp domain-containing protein